MSVVKRPRARVVKHAERDKPGLLDDIVGGAIRWPVNNLRDSWRDGHQPGPRQMSDMRVNAGPAPMAALVSRLPQLASRISQGGAAGDRMKVGKQFVLTRTQDGRILLQPRARGKDGEAALRAFLKMMNNRMGAKPYNAWRLVQRGALASMPMDDWAHDRAWTLDR